MKQPTFKNLRFYFKEYCRHTSIHGFFYLGETRSYGERIWWLIIFLTTICICGFFIRADYVKWDSSPVIVSFATKETPIYEIPFPAITICPETKADRRLHNFTELFIKIRNKTITKEELQQFALMNMVCTLNVSSQLKDLTNILYENQTDVDDEDYEYYDYSTEIEEELFSFLDMVTPRYFFLFCTWMNDVKLCNNFFRPIITDAGVCYTFNMLDKTEIYEDAVAQYNFSFSRFPPGEKTKWKIENGYPPDDDIITYPRRALFSGAKNSFDIILADDMDNVDHICNPFDHGFKITLHIPIRTPRPKQEFIRVPLNAEVIAAIKPSMITTTKTVENFKPEKRECYFDKDRKLKYFKIYTHRNCLLECLTEFTYWYCDCVDFFMPRYKDTPICGYLNKNCIAEAAELFEMRHLRGQFEKRTIVKFLPRRKSSRKAERQKNITENPLDNAVRCDCLPLCTDLSYDVETTATPWDWRNTMSILSHNSFMQPFFENPNISLSRLTLYFKNSQFITSKRHELYGPTDFLGNFGGLLGLFTGFSVLSLMEIIYFLTLRIYYNIKLYKVWSGRKEEKLNSCRVWWFIVFSFVLAICIFQIKEVYHKWERTPVIVSFATSETPIYSIPFPAVTICPESKSRLSVYNHTDIAIKLQNQIDLNATEQRNALYMSLLCDVDRSTLYKLNKIGQNVYTDDFLTFMNKTRNSHFFKTCKWMNEEVKCEELFTPTITDEGICYSFNMLDREDIFNDEVLFFDNFMKNPERRNLTWNLDKGYSKDDLLETYPRRASFAGVQNSLEVTMVTPKNDIDHICKDSVQGYKVALHTPMRIPRPSQQYFRVPLDEVVLGTIQPVMITTSDTVKVYNPKRRECYFPPERQLKYFKIYTQLNCNLECLTNFTLQLCRCVNFFMPRLKGYPICGAGKKRCMLYAEKYLQTKGLINKLKPMNDSSQNKTEDNDDIQVPSCDCMPICTDLSYDVETSQANWQWQEKQTVLYPNKKNFIKNFHQSRLNLYFKNSQFVTSKRHELYGPTDFLANFGGLLGLFTGFSILSLMEVIYFLTVRICCNLNLYGIWYGPDA
ncbi:uncharacterized protein LOC115874287 [Sitophilus oryzae]|uniref:Uncharacterized protein LOC115874287 n=1 Tax=Sitophilus oryzae TaxID=7048 RepID=A0A6J2X2V9_SITOR|nr:uncharacterized protein LOC115874287 [Sitophilus oryzae]